MPNDEYIYIYIFFSQAIHRLSEESVTGNDSREIPRKFFKESHHGWRIWGNSSLLLLGNKLETLFVYKKSTAVFGSLDENSHQYKPNIRIFLIYIFLEIRRLLYTQAVYSVQYVQYICTLQYT